MGPCEKSSAAREAQAKLLLSWLHALQQAFSTAAQAGRGPLTQLHAFTGHTTLRQQLEHAGSPQLISGGQQVADCCGCPALLAGEPQQSAVAVSEHVCARVLLPADTAVLLASDKRCL